jgi:NAD-dependent aldehyde dehydrogenases
MTAKMRNGGSACTAENNGSTIIRTEIFGPAASLVSFDDTDDTVRMANDTVFGLISYVFADEREALRVAHQLESGMGAVNRGVLGDPAALFGGMKQSGLGWEGRSEGILEFLEEKYTALTM